MLELNHAKLDVAKVANGVWWAIHVNADGTIGGEALRGAPGDKPALLIRPMGVEWERALDEARRPHLNDIRNKTLAPEVDREIVAKAAANSLWLDVANITIGGEPLKLSKERAATMLASPAWWNLCDFILAVSRDRQSLVAQEEEKAAGN
jgi:hypothetical protein